MNFDEPGDLPSSANLKYAAGMAEFIAAALENLPDPVLLVDPTDLSILDTNGRRSPLFGHASEELRGQTLLALFPGMTRELLSRAIRGQHDPHADVPLRLDVRWKDGRRAPVDIRASHATDRAKGPWLVALRAISESARSAERELVTATCASPYAMVTWDLQGQILSFNPAATELYGLEPDTAIGQKAELLVPPANRLAFRSRVDAVKAGETFGPATVPRQRWTDTGQEAQVVEVEEMLVPIRDVAKEIVRIGSYSRPANRQSRPVPQMSAALERLEDVERQHVLRVLDLVQGNRTLAAERLGISRSTLNRKLAAWD